MDNPTKAVYVLERDGSPRADANASKFSFERAATANEWTPFRTTMVLLADARACGRGYCSVCSSSRRGSGLKPHNNLVRLQKYTTSQLYPHRIQDQK